MIWWTVGWLWFVLKWLLISTAVCCGLGWAFIYFRIWWRGRWNLLPNYIGAQQRRWYAEEVFELFEDEPLLGWGE